MAAKKNTSKSNKQSGPKRGQVILIMPIVIQNLY